MTDLAIRTALEAANPAADDLLDAITSEFPLALQDADDIQSLDLTDDDVRVVIADKTIFEYDSSDTTTAHDGTTCLVSSDGKRFKTDSAIVLNRSVLSATTTSPPGSPSLGDVYRVPASPSGGWAAKANNLAIYAASGWVYIAPADLGVGYFHYVEDTDTFEYYDASSAWVDFTVLTTDSVDPRYERYPFGLSVENATTDTPPGGPSAGVAYIVASGGTGAWSGWDDSVAVYLGGAWVEFAPYEGATVYDKDTDSPLIYQGGTWESASAGRTKGYAVSLNNSSSGTINDDSSPENADQTGNNSKLITTITYTAKSDSNYLEIHVSGEFYVTGINCDQFALLLFEDTDSSPTDYKVFASGFVGDAYTNGRIETTFVVAVPDTSSHQWRFRVSADLNTGASGTLNWKRCDMTLKENEVG